MALALSSSLLLKSPTSGFLAAHNKQARRRRSQGTVSAKSQRPFLAVILLLSFNIKMQYTYRGSKIASPPPKRRRVSVPMGNRSRWGEHPPPQSFSNSFSARHLSPVTPASSSNDGPLLTGNAFSGNNGHSNSPFANTLTYSCSPKIPATLPENPDKRHNMSHDHPIVQQPKAVSLSHDIPGPRNNLQSGNHFPSPHVYSYSTKSGAGSSSDSTEGSNAHFNGTRRRLGQRAALHTNTPISSSRNAPHNVTHLSDSHHSRPQPQGPGISPNGSILGGHTHLDQPVGHIPPSSPFPQTVLPHEQLSHGQTSVPRAHSEGYNLDPSMRPEANESPRVTNQASNEHQINHPAQQISSQDMVALRRTQQQMLDMLHAFKNQSVNQLLSSFPANPNHTWNLSRTPEDFLRWKSSVSAGSSPLSNHKDSQSNGFGSMGVELEGLMIPNDLGIADQAAVPEALVFQNIDSHTNGARPQQQLVQFASWPMDTLQFGALGPADQGHDMINSFANLEQTPNPPQAPEQIPSPMQAVAPMASQAPQSTDDMPFPNIDMQVYGAHHQEPLDQVAPQPADQFQYNLQAPGQGYNLMNPVGNVEEMPHPPQEPHPIQSQVQAASPVPGHLDNPGHMQHPPHEPQQIHPHLQAAAPALPEPLQPAAAAVDANGQPIRMCKKPGCDRPRQHQTARSRFCTVHLENGMPRSRGGAPNQDVVANDQLCSGCNALRPRRAPGKACWECFCKNRRQRKQTCPGCPASTCPNRIAEDV